MKTNFKIAYRFLKSNKGQTILITMGIAIGISVQIFLGLLIKNLNDDLVNNTIGNTSQITVMAKDKKDKLFTDYDSITKDIKAANGNKIKQVMGVLDSPALIQVGDSSQSIIVRGMDYSKNQDIYDLKNKIIAGSFPSSENEILIGKGLKTDINLQVGDTIKISTPDKRNLELKVSGIADFKVKELNNTWAVTSLSFAQKLFKEEGKLSSIEMKVDKGDIFSTDEFANNLSQVIPSTLKVENWKGNNESLLNALSGQKSSSLTIQIFIIISVTMGISSVLAISVMQKSKQIGILKAMGIKNSSAASIFLIQGLLLGIIGAIVGTGLGIGLFNIFNMLVKTSEGKPLMSGNIYMDFIAISVVLSITASVVAAGVAARKSLKLNPMEVIRNN
ncbi:FtsX-like permease family protein [Clostridium estertheticum]|uniref:ABC transporter permease n=1 Tax=Clostridium estertheticum TaxID=238834 RepID=UPI0013E98581|nr:FtsX-like permease family protein [Clostridium estertheticum]MBZ9685795.1 FtsX-like permease family protein [Clostridium estertheticum]